jgi:hypothetical protein
MPVPMPNGTLVSSPKPPPSTANIAAAHNSVHKAAEGLVKLGNPPKRKNRKTRKNRKNRKDRKSRKNRKDRR